MFSCFCLPVKYLFIINALSSFLNAYVLKTILHWQCASTLETLFMANC